MTWSRAQAFQHLGRAFDALARAFAQARNTPQGDAEVRAGVAERDPDSVPPPEIVGGFGAFDAGLGSPGFGVVPG